MDQIIHEAQLALIAAGFGVGPTGADGDWGANTRKAMRAFEAVRHLPITQTLDGTVLNALLGRSVPLTRAPWGIELDRLMRLRIKEVPGKGSSPIIMGMADDLGLDHVYTDDDEAWCGLCEGEVMHNTLPDEPLPNNLLGAVNWRHFGVACDEQMDAIAVMWRQSPTSGLGHVGQVVAANKSAICVRAGNTKNTVGDAWISRSRVLAFRWPGTGPKPMLIPLPNVPTSGPLSTNEA